MMNLRKLFSRKNLLNSSSIRKQKTYGEPVVYLFRTVQKRRSISGKIGYFHKTSIRFYWEAIEFMKIKSGDFIRIYVSENTIGLEKVKEKDNFSFKLTKEGKLYLLLNVGKIYDLSLKNGKYKIKKILMFNGIERFYLKDLNN